MALRLLFDQLDQQTRADLARPDDTAAFLAKSTGVSITVWQKAMPRLERGVHYPLSDAIIKAQQDSADVALRNKLIPRHIDVRQAIGDIR